MEYLFIIAFLLLAVGLLFVFALTMFDDSNRVSKAQIAVAKLKNAADEVDGLGEGNVRIVEIELPAEVAIGRALEKEILFVLNWRLGGTGDTYANTNASLSYVSLPTGEGLHLIKVESIDGNVLLSEV